MPIRLRLSFLALACSLLAGSLTVAAQQVATDPAAAPLDAKIPVDPQIATGQLPNGLRYYVRANQKPEDRAELRLVVNVGSILEEDDQLGLAHFVEHMAFNGTKNFPKLEIIAFMESIGMRFGPSVNAYTSFDETVYMLQIPTGKPEVIDRALLILEDWAHNVSFDAEEIDKERGVIIEEWRSRRGANARVQDKQLPVLLQDSQYAVRLPIGKPEILQNFRHERLRKFYTDWYRPDLMAVIAVGDFERDDMVRRIQTRFGAIPKPASPPRREVHTVPSHDGTSYIVSTDPELSGTQVAVYNLEPTRDESTVGAYRQQIVEGLFAGMLSDRYSEIAQKPDAPFLGASASHGQVVRAAEATILSAVVREGGLERGLEALLTEAERVARFGFTATELDRQKRNIVRNLDRAVQEKDNQVSASLAAEFARSFLTTEPIPGIVYERALYERFLPTITLAEINKLARAWLADRNRVVMASAPEKPGVPVATQAVLAKVIEGVKEKELTAYVDTTTERALLETPPAPGRIVSRSNPDEHGISEWRLSNGIRVLLKPTTFKQDEVLFRAFSPGGHSLAPDEDYVAASTASQVIAAGGLGNMSAIELGKMLTGKIASVRPSIAPLEEGLAGGGSPKDLETLFQLIYLTFTAPRADPQIFKVLVDNARTSLANQTARPEYVFGTTLNEVLTQNHPRARPLTPERLSEMNLERSLAFYKDRFADASDFTFVFVGTFDPEALAPLVEQYLASLPSSGRKENWRDLGIRPPDEAVTRRVEKGIEPKSQTTLVYTGPFTYDPQHRATMRALGLVLENRLRMALREELGGTYGVSVSPSTSRIPRQEYSFSIGFGSAPDRTDALVQRVTEEIDRLKEAGPTDKEVADVREILVRDHESGLLRNDYLLGNLAGRLQAGEDVDSLFDAAELFGHLSPTAVRNAAREYLDSDDVVRVSLFPEK